MKDQSTDPPAGPKKKKGGFQKRLLIGFAVLVVAIVLLSRLLSMPYYDTPTELLAAGSGSIGKNMRVKGTVAAEGIERDVKNLTLKFTLVDRESTLPVVYRGVVPDTFEAGRDAVVEGKYTQDGTFNATNLLVQCPSKFEPKTPS